MAKRQQLRRGTEEENKSFTGAVGEPIYLTDKKTTVIHDGETVGGIEMAREDRTNLTTEADIIIQDGTNRLLVNPMTFTSVTIGNGSTLKII